MNHEPDIILRCAPGQLPCQDATRAGYSRSATAAEAAVSPQSANRRVNRPIQPAALRMLETTRLCWRRPLA